MENGSNRNVVKLPPADIKGKVSIEEVINSRRSVRRFKAEPLSLKQLAQILWSAQGLTGDKIDRAVPSAGATFPLEIYVLTGDSSVESLKPAVYHYEPVTHTLKTHSADDRKKELSSAALDQECIVEAPISIIICASYIRTTKRYRERGIRYVHMEAGHAGQNVSLQAISLGLASVMVGAFNDEKVAEAISLKGQIKPLYIIPVGKPI